MAFWTSDILTKGDFRDVSKFGDTSRIQGLVHDAALV